jgi:hypothetical protein
MPSDTTPAEFVGGPIDGQQRILAGEPETWEVDEFASMKVTTHIYRRRRIDGIGVRLPNGLVPYDWQTW